MPQKHDDSDNSIEKQERQQLSAKIGDHVMQALGQPSDLHQVQIRRLWQDHFRVNILVGVDVLNAKVAHSYFVVADSGGNIIASTPKIVREYRPLTSAVSARGNVPCPSAAT